MKYKNVPSNVAYFLRDVAKMDMDALEALCEHMGWLAVRVETIYSQRDKLNQIYDVVMSVPAKAVSSVIDTSSLTKMLETFKAAPVYDQEDE